MSGIYIYGLGDLPAEQINNSTGAVQYLHHDQAGSTRLLTGSTGKTEGSYSYSAYGTPEHTGTATTPLGYDGQYTSSDTGLVYLRNRVYDPSTAQFLTRDPLEALTGEPYAYANDNPINEADPTGLGFFGELEELGEEVGNGVAGFGDKVTFGLTKKIREAIGDENVDTCSAGYQAGGYAGLATAALIPGEDEAVGADEGVGIAEGSAEHIFRDAEGHLAEDTPENRALIESAVKSENYVRTGGRGEELYRETLPNGTQVWAKAFNGSITNGASTKCHCHEAGGVVRVKLGDLDDVSLTASQAFRALEKFMSAYFDRTNGEGPLRTLLGDVEIESDGSSTDPAALGDWRECVRVVLAEDGDIRSPKD